MRPTKLDRMTEVADLRRRFEERVDRAPGHGPAGECHLWTGCKNSDGYGQIWDGRSAVKAHRVAYFLHTGKWPDTGMCVLHAPVICRTRCCVNPDHLRLGTHSANMRDRITDGTNPFAARTHCQNGHPYDESNTKISNGKRYCRACIEASKLDEDRRRTKREYMREYRNNPVNRDRASEYMKSYKPIWRARRRAEGLVPS